MANHAYSLSDRSLSRSTRRPSCSPAVIARTIGVVSMGLILGTPLVACRATKAGSGSEMAARSVRLPATLATRESWDGLSPEARLEILDSEYRAYPPLKLTEPRDPGALTNPQEKALADKMLTYMKSTTDLRIEDKSHGQIGAMQTSVRILLLNGETILGGEVRLVQKGCEMPDQTAPRFATEALAKKAGCAVSDQSGWEAVGQFNYDGVPYAVSDFIEWIGN